MGEKKKYTITLDVEKDGEGVTLKLNTTGYPTLNDTMRFLQLAMEGVIKQAQQTVAPKAVN